jgi:hypothetical protein
VGLDEARELVTLLHELDAAWRAEAEQVMPDLVNAPEPHLMAEMEITRALATTGPCRSRQSIRRLDGAERGPSLAGTSAHRLVVLSSR